MVCRQVYSPACLALNSSTLDKNVRKRDEITVCKRLETAMAGRCPEQGRTGRLRHSSLRLRRLKWFGMEPVPQLHAGAITAMWREASGKQTIRMNGFPIFW